AMTFASILRPFPWTSWRPFSALDGSSSPAPPMARAATATGNKRREPSSPRGPRRIDTEEGPHAQSQQDGHRAHRLVRIHLGSTRPAVLEHDWRFANATACPATAIEHLLLERIARGQQVIEIGLPQLGHAVTAVGPTGIVGRDPKQEPYHRVD